MDNLGSKATKIVTGTVRFAYVNVWEPKGVNGGEEKYSVCLIISKEDKNTLKKISSAVEAALREGAAKLAGMVAVNLKLPLRDGDQERPDDEAFANSYFLNAINTYKPYVVDHNVQPILNPSEFYSGCYGKASLVFYAFNSKGNMGIACGLQNLQKLADGEPLGVRSRPEEDFEVITDPDDLLL